jgi:hypothetical protein
MARKGEVLAEDDEVQDDQQQEELVVVEDEPQEQEAAEEDDGDDERIAREADDDDDEVDDERAEIRERRRKEKHERRERREKAITRDKVELDFLRQRNDDLERRLTAQEQRSHVSDLNSYDTQIGQASNEIQMAERVIAKAIEAGNGEDVAQALRFRDQAMAKLQQLNYAKQQAAQQQPKRDPNQLDELTMSYAREFIDEHPWYDPQGRNEESAVVIAIDQALAKDGYNSQTEEYWTELRKRAARRLPEKFEAPKRQERTPRGGPAVGSGKEHAPTSTRREIYISPERKQALIDAGVWDDPVLRSRYVKRYAEYDKQNRA